MKNIQNLILTLAVVALSFACEKHSPLDELGDLGGANVANVYMEPLAPKIQAGLTRELEVQYWSLDDNFTYTGLWDSVAVSQIHIVTIEGVEFSASSSVTVHDWKEYKSYSFDFANWAPENKAYTRKVSYTIDLAYDKVTQDKSKITIDQFLAEIPEDFSEDMYAFFTDNLSRATLNALLVDNNAMTQSEFDGHYGDNGSLTSDGEVAVIAGMNQLGNKKIIGDAYKLDSEYQVFLAFRATNGSGVYNDYTRSFLVF